MRKPASRGFTLIELMVVLAIMGILVMIAYPQYQNYIVKAHRANGQQFLLDLAQRQEQFLTDARQYGLTTEPEPSDLRLPRPDEVARDYQIPVIAVNAAGERPYFMAALVPVAGGLMAKDGRLIVTSRGDRWRESDDSCTISGTPGGGCTFSSSTDHAWD